LQFSVILYYKREIDAPTPDWAVNFPCVIKMTEKRQTSQGYIIRILQHFATKLRNITNFVMLFQAVIVQAYLDQNLVYNANGPLK
jgi:hypothetical protein